MSTVVVAKKDGKVCIAADSLTSFGDLKLTIDMTLRTIKFCVMMKII